MALGSEIRAQVALLKFKNSANTEEMWFIPKFLVEVLE